MSKEEFVEKFNNCVYRDDYIMLYAQVIAILFEKIEKLENKNNGK